MVAQRKIRCAVVAITAENTGMNNDAGARPELTPRFRPSDLLPWADPYIAGLVRKLQAEVRSERTPAPRAADLATLRAELEMPWTGAANDEREAAEPADDRDRRSPLAEPVR